MRRRSLELLNVQPGERVLIVGAGTGLDLEFLSKKARVIATDLTAAMLRNQRREMEDKPPVPRPQQKFQF